MTTTRKTRVFGLVMALVFALSMLAGCGSDKIHATLTVKGPEEAVTEYKLEVEPETTLMAAMLEEGLVSEEEAAAGFFTAVNGVVADFEADGAWWAVLDANGEMTPVGAGEIVLAEGDAYTIAYTVG